MTSQKSRIREYLESGKSLTPGQARNWFCCQNLSARVHEINQDYIEESVPGRRWKKIVSVIEKKGKGKRLTRYHYVRSRLAPAYLD